MLPPHVDVAPASPSRPTFYPSLTLPTFAPLSCARSMSRGFSGTKQLMSLLRIRLRVLLIAVFTFLLSFSSASAARDGSTDRPGLDYNSFELSAPNPDLCESACKKDGKCRSWTYSWPGAKGPKAMCALKTGVPPKRSDTCCISGVISTSSPVTRTDDPAPAPAPVPKPQTTERVETPAKPEKPVVAAPKPLPAPLPPAAPATPRETVTVTPKAKPELPKLKLPLPETEPQPATPDPAKEAACNDYASRAIEQNNENKTLSCGLTGSRWGFARENYFSYCMRSPSSAYNAARAARDSDLANCRRDIATRREPAPDPILPEINVPGIDDLFNSDGRSARFCRNFAAQSIRQVREAELLDCGFGGRIWSSSRIRQGQLCENVGPREAAGILNDRSRQIEACRRSAGGYNDNQGFGCNEYARTAVQQAQEARRLDCGYRGSRWTRNYRAHLNWCRKVPQVESSREFRAREQLLAQCQ